MSSVVVFSAGYSDFQAPVSMLLLLLLLLWCWSRGGAGTRGNWQPEETGKCNGFTGELRIIISLYGHLIDWIN